MDTNTDDKTSSPWRIVRSIDRRLLITVLLVVSLVTASAAAGLTTIAVDETQSDFQNGQTTGGVTAFADDTVGVDPTVGTTAGPPSFSNTQTNLDAGPTAGLAFVPNQDLDAIYFEFIDGVQFNTQTDIVLKDAQGNVLTEFSPENNQGNSLFYDFKAGTKYRLEIRDIQDSVENASSNDAGFPYNSTDIDIVSGSESGSDTNQWWNIFSITAVENGFQTGSYENSYTVTDAEEVFIELDEIDVQSDGANGVLLSINNDTDQLYSNFISSNTTVDIDGSGTETYTVTVQTKSEAVDTKTGRLR